MATLRSFQLMVSAAVPEGVICRRETRGGAGRMATHTSVPMIAPLAMIAATPTSATRRHSRHNRRRGRLRNSRLERALQRQPDVADGLHALSGIFLQAAS